MSPDRTTSQTRRIAALLAALAPSRRQGVVLTDDGAEVIDVADVFDETVLDCFWREVLAYLITGDASALRAFQGVQVAGRELVSDGRVVADWLYRRGRFSR
jgi:hypothetical protein